MTTKPIRESLSQRSLDKSKARYDVHKALTILDKIGPLYAPPGVTEAQFEEILRDARKALDSL